MHLTQASNAESPCLGLPRTRSGMGHHTHLHACLRTPRRRSFHTNSKQTHLESHFTWPQPNGISRTKERKKIIIGLKTDLHHYNLKNMTSFHILSVYKLVYYLVSSTLFNSTAKKPFENTNTYSLLSIN